MGGIHALSAAFSAKAIIQQATFHLCTRVWTPAFAGDAVRWGASMAASKSRMKISRGPAEIANGWGSIKDQILRHPLAHGRRGPGQEGGGET